MNYIYDNLDFIVTLRCNSQCLNCIRFCNMEDITGLNYVDTDVTLAQVDKFIQQVTDIYKGEAVIGTVILSGGEPLLHKDIIEITKRIKEQLVDTGKIGAILVNSNLRIKAPPEVSPYIINYVPYDRKSDAHNVALLHPDDMKKERMSFAKCGHYRKWRPVLSCYGYNMCCAAQGYICLFGLDNLFIDTLPDDPQKFPLLEMTQVCQHCPFPHMTESSYLEKCLGRPVSKIYKEQGDINKRGERISKRF